MGIRPGVNGGGGGGAFRAAEESAEHSSPPPVFKRTRKGEPAERFPNRTSYPIMGLPGGERRRITVTLCPFRPPCALPAAMP